MGIRETIDSLARSPWIRDWISGRGLAPWIHSLVGLWLPMLALATNMWTVRRFTVDDAYISFRYARNLAEGHGLVYNVGQQVEGYTNFLWTVLLGGGMAFGIDPHVTAKVMGGLCALASLYFVYRISDRLLPHRTVPCIATWMVASSGPFSGYAMFGLETAAFTGAVLGGAWLTMQEEADKRRVPWSGLVFAAAGLTRPEAPLFLGLALLFLPHHRDLFSRRNLLRALLFALPVGAHLVWRRLYYGAWVPSTLTAKTGDFDQQFWSGVRYIRDYINHVGPLSWFAAYGIALGVVRLNRERLYIAFVVGAWAVYLLLVGGDWMPFFRYIVPVEPFLFLLVGLALRRLVEYRDLAGTLALVAVGIYLGWARQQGLEAAQYKFIHQEHRFWRKVGGETARWLVRHEPGVVAIGDIGYVGYETNYPILDILGLVDPVIADLPGGYTRKLGPRWVDRILDAKPDYIVIVMGGNCDRPDMDGSKQLYHDRRFREYEVGHRVAVGDGGWCIYQRSDARRTERIPPTPPADDRG